MRRITAAGVTLVTAMAFGCEGNGTSYNSTGPLQCEALQGAQGVNNWSNCLSYTNGGGGGGGGGGGKGTGLAPAALYRLIKVNGNPLPFTMDSDSVSVAGDSSRVIHVVLDSSIISLNTDSTVTQLDYFNIRDYRFSSVNNTPPAHAINWSAISFPDTSTGRWTDSTGQPQIELLSGRVSNIGYLYSGDTLTANYPFTYTDTSNTAVAILAVFTYQNVGSPNHQLVKYPNVVKSRARGSQAIAIPSSPIRQSRAGSPGLSFMGSNDGSRRLVRVIGQ